MIRIRWWALILVALVAAGFAALLTLWVVKSGHNPWHVSPWVTQILLLLSIYLVLSGWAVRQMQKGKATVITMNQQLALRVLLLAQASAILGAIVAGFFAGQLTTVLYLLEVGAKARTIGADIFAVICGLILVVSGLLTQHWCSIRGDGDDKESAKKAGFRKLSAPPNAGTA